MFTNTEYQSWGRIPVATHNPLFVERDMSSFQCVPDNHLVLPYGLGRSYGDSCLNHQNTILVTGKLNNFLSFDKETGILTCESGVTLEEIIRVFLPRGWFLPVTPGTRHVTLGGAIANDVHGKNHHVSGSFGNFIVELGLWSSDGKLQTCSRRENPAQFAATVGGLGLTGLIVWAKLQLKKVSGPLIDQEIIRFGGVDEYLALGKDSESRFEYTVAWVDSTARGANVGRGLYMRGNHSTSPIAASKQAARGRPGLMCPVFFPDWALNSFSVKAFNNLYYGKQLLAGSKGVINFRPFFYPLDGVSNWNRIYGKRGFYQYQFVVPLADASFVLKESLLEIARSGLGSFLSVIKNFGNISSVGMMSFPREGVTLALDFPNCGDATAKLFQRLDRIVLQANGALYPAKDARMPGELFRSSFPRLDEFIRHIDPAFSSSFWRRVV